MTFAQFHALSKQRNENQKLLDYGFGTVAAMIGEPNRDKKTKASPFSWLDFYPHWKDRSIIEQLKKGKSPEQLKAKFLSGIKPIINSKASNRGN